MSYSRRTALSQASSRSILFCGFFVQRAYPVPLICPLCRAFLSPSLIFFLLGFSPLTSYNPFPSVRIRSPRSLPPFDDKGSSERWKNFLVGAPFQYLLRGPYTLFLTGTIVARFFRLEFPSVVVVFIGPWNRACDPGIRIFLFLSPALFPISSEGSCAIFSELFPSAL